MTMSELAERIHRDRSTVTTLVHKLVDRGYVAFGDNPEDARSKLVHLTEAGRNLSTVFACISQELAEVTWRGIGDEDRQVCREALKQIIGNFTESVEPGEEP